MVVHIEGWGSGPHWKALYGCQSPDGGVYWIHTYGHYLYRWEDETCHLIGWDPE